MLASGSPGNLGRVPVAWRVEVRVPYTVTLFAPGEFGFWVATGRADQPDFVSFSPAALCLGLNLLRP